MFMLAVANHTAASIDTSTDRFFYAATLIQIFIY